MRKRRARGQYCTVCTPPLSIVLFQPAWGNCPVSALLKLTLLVGLMETCFVVVQVELCPIWSLREDPST